MNLAELFIRVTGDTSDVTQKLGGVQKSLGGLKESAEKAHGGVGRLNNAFAGMATQIAGANPVLGKAAEIIGSLGVGGTVLTGALAGIALLAYAWDKLTKSARDATKAQDEASKRVGHTQLTKAEGPGGQNVLDIGLLNNKLQKLTKTRRKLLDAINNDPLGIAPFQEGRLEDLDTEIADVKTLITLTGQWKKEAVALANVQSLGTAFSFAAERGEALDGFYKQALASEAELTQIAKTGTGEVRNAAIQALGGVEAILDRLKLIRVGLAVPSSKLGGVAAGVFAGAAASTQGALTAQINMAAQHGTSIGNFSKEVGDLANTIGTVARHDIKASTGNAFKTSVQATVDALDLVQDAIRMAGATPAEQQAIAAGVRGGARTSGSPELVNIEAQKRLGQSLADREAALNLPAAFDAVRETAVGAGEQWRSATQAAALLTERFKSLHVAMLDFKTSLLNAATSFASQFSVGNLANTLLSRVAGDTSSIGGQAGGLAGTLLGGKLGAGLGVFGGPIGMAIGGAIGSGIGNLVGGLFDHKSAVDRNTRALNNLTASLLGAPSGFKVQGYNYAVSDAKTYRDLAQVGRRLAARGGRNGFQLQGT